MPSSATRRPPPRRGPPLRHGGAATRAAKPLFIAALATLLAIAGVRYLHYAAQFERTDDAYLDGKVHAVSARVAGTVAEVLTDDNRLVREGEPLLKLDPRDLQVRVDEARSERVSAEAAVAQAEAQVGQARGAVEEAVAGIAQTKAQLDKTALDLRRADELIREKASPQEELDTATANNEVATANAAGAQSTREAARAMLRAAEASLRVALAKRETAETLVHDAELQLSYTTVLAPADGRVGKKSVEVGQRVQPGQALLAVVSPETWVVANFKENQLARMKPGQTVDIEIDAIANHTFTGTVESFSPGTGARFSLLPPDNATGNFTKVVQRLPVKIRFTPESVRGYEERLAPGLSAVVTVRVRP